MGGVVIFWASTDVVSGDGTCYKLGRRGGLGCSKVPLFNRGGGVMWDILLPFEQGALLRTQRLITESFCLNLHL